MTEPQQSEKAMESHSMTPPASSPESPAPLPLDADTRRIIGLAKQQFATWGQISGQPKPVPWQRDVDGWVKTDESRNLAETLATLLDIGGHRIAVSQHRRHAAILVIHALEEIDELRAALRSTREELDDARAELFRRRDDLDTAESRLARVQKASAHRMQQLDAVLGGQGWSFDTLIDKAVEAIQQGVEARAALVKVRDILSGDSALGSPANYADRAHQAWLVACGQGAAASPSGAPEPEASSDTALLDAVYETRSADGVRVPMQGRTLLRLLGASLPSEPSPTDSRRSHPSVQGNTAEPSRAPACHGQDLKA